jgi:hypothetical protein
MKKDAVYSLRLSQRVRNALQIAADEKHRSVASLLDDIITDWLETEGYLKHHEPGMERRRFIRKPLSLSCHLRFKDQSGKKDLPGKILDLSIGGVRIRIPNVLKSNLNFGKLPPRFVLFPEFPSQAKETKLNCTPCHFKKENSSVVIGAVFAALDTDQKDFLSQYLA